MSNSKNVGKSVDIMVSFSCMTSKEKDSIKVAFEAFCEFLYQKFDLFNIRCAEVKRG